MGSYQSFLQQFHPEYGACIQDKNRAAIDLSYSLNLKTGGAIAQMWSQSLADSEIAVTEHSNYVAGVNMVLEDGLGDNLARRKRIKKKRSISSIENSFYSHSRHQYKRDTGSSYYGPSWKVTTMDSILASWRNPSNTKSAVHIDTTTITTQETMESKAYNGELSLPIDWIFSVNGNGGFEMQSSRNRSYQYELTADWKGMELVDVEPGEWYKNNFGMAALVDPIASPQPMRKEKFNQYYGPQGPLRRITSRLLVGYQPVFSATMSSSDIQFLHKSWTAGASVCVLILCAGPNFSGDKTKAQATFNGNTLTIAMNSDSPILLGIGYDEYHSFNETKVTKPTSKVSVSNTKSVGRTT